MTALTLHNSIVHMAVSERDDILVVDETGTVHIWKNPIYPQKSKNEKSYIKTSFKINCNNTPVPVFFADFGRTQRVNQVFLVYGSTTGLKFEFAVSGAMGVKMAVLNHTVDLLRAKRNACSTTGYGKKPVDFIR
jgi:hypothetical protein